jgi:transposase InsO family protein
MLDSMSSHSPPVIPLPRSWPDNVSAAFLCAIALAHRGMIFVRAWCENSPIERVRLAGRLAASDMRASLVEREMALLRARFGRIPPEKRPHYSPEERLEILAIKAETGWTARKLAERLLVSPITIASWLRRVDEEGPQALVRMRVPVNRFPDFVRELVRHLKESCPAMGTVKISQMLARAGLHLAPTSVMRFSRAKEPKPELPPQARTARTQSRSGRTVIARRPNHVWGIDHSTISTGLGFWVPWMPGAIIPVWPFCFWLSVVVDHFSRRVLAVGVYLSEPTGEETALLLERARKRAGRAPKYTVTDHGVQFQYVYRTWCERWRVTPRFGAIGKYGSIALVERFWRTMKAEAFGPGRRLVPLSRATMVSLSEHFARWYNESRPHQGLTGRTPNEVFFAIAPANSRPRLEPRARYPAHASCAAPRAGVRGKSGVKLELVVNHPDGAPHLPVIEIRTAA